VTTISSHRATNAVAQSPLQRTVGSLRAEIATQTQTVRKLAASARDAWSWTILSWPTAVMFAVVISLTVTQPEQSRQSTAVATASVTADGIHAVVAPSSAAATISRHPASRAINR
jgi:hypothetical protein